MIVTTKDAMDTKFQISDLEPFVIFVVKAMLFSLVPAPPRLAYIWIRFSAFSSRINFFYFGEISGRSRMPLTVFGKVESKWG